MTAMDEVTAAANLKQLVRSMIDGEFAAQLPFEDLLAQLAQIAREAASANGLNLASVDSMKAMRALANELHAQPAMGLAA